MRYIGLLTLLLLAGCSGHFRLPWETDPFDPSRIVTREPLEIPPDLDRLPVPGITEEDPDRAVVRARDIGSTTAGQILFGAPKPAPVLTAPVTDNNLGGRDLATDDRPLPKTKPAKMGRSGNGRKVLP
ncbi:MAG: hypothetical protein HQL58_08550 [Magnetococcales bacterium]|nr:hypothetical protein [Magnetococcales bacterium]